MRQSHDNRIKTATAASVRTTVAASLTLMTAFVSLLTLMYLQLSPFASTSFLEHFIRTDVRTLAGDAFQARSTAMPPGGLFRVVSAAVGLPIVSAKTAASSPHLVKTSHPSRPAKAVSGATSTRQAANPVSRQQVAPAEHKPVPSVASVSSPKKIVLGWTPWNTPAATVEMLRQNPHITVLSPKWLSIQNVNGSIASSIEPSVVTYAHQHHIQVWALLDNQFSADLTHAVLSRTSIQAKMVSEITHLAIKNHLDGINLDFESLYSGDEGSYTSFVGRLHDALQRHNVNLSVDVTPDIVFLRDNAAYFHAGLAAVADEVIIMAYDEHWSTDPTPGPVADVPWVKESVLDLLDTGVPADKLVLGIPFYARFWHVTTNGVDSIAVANSAVAQILASHHATSTFLPNLGVAYARYAKPDGYEEVWYENAATLKQKLSLVSQEGLAGVAIWSLPLSDSTRMHTVVHAMQMSGQ